MSNLHLFWKEGMTFMKYFRGSATYTVLGTSAVYQSLNKKLYKKFSFFAVPIF
jgi:hypothetical protein